MSTLPEGAIYLDHPDWSPSHRAWVCYGDAVTPMADLVGKVVNIGTKDGVVYDTATVVSFSDSGTLVLEGGRKRSPWPPGATETEGREEIHCHDIARGYIHPEGGRR